MKKTLLASAAIVGLLFTGCAFKATPTAVTMDVTKIDFTKLESMKQGEACISRFLIFTTGYDKTLREAVEDAGITDVKYVEEHVSTGFFTSSKCLVVYGN